MVGFPQVLTILELRTGHASASWRLEWCSIDASDYAMVLNNYGARKIADPTFWATNELWKADFNRDDKIDCSDYASVLNNYGKGGDIFYYMH